MNTMRHLLLCVTLCWLGAAQSGGESRLDEQYGLRIHAPNANWVFHESDGLEVRAFLKQAQDPVLLRLRTPDNLKLIPEDELLNKLRQNQPKLRFDPGFSSALVNGRRWYTMTGKTKDMRFSLQFNFEKEKIFMLQYEAPTPELFQKYASDRDTFLARLEFNAVPVKPLSQFEALEIEFVPVEKANMKPEDISHLTEEIRKRLMASEFKEVRPTRTPATEKTLLLTVRVRSFERGSRVQRYAIGYGAGQTVLDGDLVFTDKETGKVLYAHQMSYETSGGLFGGASYKGAAEHIVEVIRVKRKN